MELKFNNGLFKIVQIADTQDGKNISPDTLELIDAALEKVKPDLVVFTGDQIWGKMNFKGDKELVRSTLYKLLSPVISRNIPFTVSFGNHDRQVGVSNAEQLDIYRSFPGCVAEESEVGVDGTGNHVLELLGENNKPHFLIYMIDSHTNDALGYDCVHENQIEWYKRTRDRYSEKYGSVIPSIVFQHIPLCEVFELLSEVNKHTKHAVRAFRAHANQWYVLNKSKVNQDGFMKESPADPDNNSGEFTAFKEKGDVKGVYFGHDHNNSFNGKIDGIDLGYTQGAGFHVYGPGLDRGVRVFEISESSPENYKTYDLRYRDLVGKKPKEPLRFLMYQIMPTNTFDAVHRLEKAAIAAAGITAGVMIIKKLKSK